MRFKIYKYGKNDSKIFIESFAGELLDIKSRMIVLQRDLCAPNEKPEIIITDIDRDGDKLNVILTARSSSLIYHKAIRQ